MRDYEDLSKNILILGFDNGEKRRYDVVPILKSGTVFESFANIENFRRVYIDDEHCVAWDIDQSVDSNVVWSNKSGFVSG